jgi:hypothetical protein
LGPDNWGHSPRTSPHVVAGPVPPRARKDEVLRNSYHGPRPPWDGLGPPRVEAEPPGGLSAWASQEGWCRHVPLRKRPLNQHRHVSGGYQPSARSQPNYRIKCWWLGCAHPRQSMGCPLTCWAGMGDCTVSPPVTEAARHITAPRAWAKDVWSHHSAARVGEE